MKTQQLFTALLFSMILTLTSCEVIGGIFKAGVWVGIIAVVGIIGLVVMLIGKAGKK